MVLRDYSAPSHYNTGMCSFLINYCQKKLLSCPSLHSHHLLGGPDASYPVSRTYFLRLSGIRRVHTPSLLLYRKIFKLPLPPYSCAMEIPPWWFSPSYSMSCVHLSCPSTAPMWLPGCPKVALVALTKLSSSTVSFLSLHHVRCRWLHCVPGTLMLSSVPFGGNLEHVWFWSCHFFLRVWPWVFPLVSGLVPRDRDQGQVVCGHIGGWTYQQEHFALFYLEYLVFASFMNLEPANTSFQCHAPQFFHLSGSRWHPCCSRKKPNPFLQTSACPFGIFKPTPPPVPLSSP